MVENQGSSHISVAKLNNVLMQMRISSMLIVIVVPDSYTSSRTLQVRQQHADVCAFAL